MKRLTVTLDGQEIEVLAQKMTGKVWFHWDGETYVHTPKTNQAQAGAGAAAQDPLKIVAPMPGKVIKVFVSKGQAVKEGETLVAMEAMKMEYNLKAIQDGRVETIQCQAGGQVGLGDVLVRLEDDNG